MTHPHRSPPPARRVPLDAGRLAALSADGWEVHVVAETGSTNSDLAAAARAGAPAGTVLVAERQTAGRGRLARRWVAPPGTGLTFSVLLRPGVPASSLSWLPMVVGAALVDTLRTRLGLAAVLKWPNDVLVDERKLAGVLVEVVPAPGQRGAVVVGVGMNVSARLDELPSGATSVSVGSATYGTFVVHDAGPGGDGDGREVRAASKAGALAVDRTDLLVALLAGLRAGQQRWEAVPSSARETYLPHCSSVGRWVRVELPDGKTVEGIATDVDEAGRLVVDGAAFSAADVVHATPRQTV